MLTNDLISPSAIRTDPPPKQGHMLRFQMDISLGRHCATHCSNRTSSQQALQSLRAQAAGCRLPSTLSPEALSRHWVLRASGEEGGLECSSSRTAPGLLQTGVQNRTPAPGLFLGPALLSGRLASWSPALQTCKQLRPLQNVLEGRAQAGAGRGPLR